ncbi:CsbD family protein [Streptomyces silvisoli]|uniref:CsbD family protein n=1 Tax=Streptomyces silvisoli TaxID=3034235 RepID=A0ABT5ZJ38_9ACTN|nr:CsbD family protein [Streptomyces silvisoli]MDF3289822.1 CsbD family protein [Streptomyces silvisoli]
MSAGKKAEHAVKRAKGKVKKDTGKAIGDPYLESEGKGEQLEGGLKQAGQNIKDAFKR